MTCPTFVSHAEVFSVYLSDISFHLFEIELNRTFEKIKNKIKKKLKPCTPYQNSKLGTLSCNRFYLALKYSYRNNNQITFLKFFMTLKTLKKMLKAIY